VHEYLHDSGGVTYPLNEVKGRKKQFLAAGRRNLKIHPQINAFSYQHIRYLSHSITLYFRPCTMRTRLLLISVLLTGVLSAQRWVLPFALTDSVFTVGSIYTGCKVNYDLNGHSYVRPESHPCLDTLADFLLKHPGMILEIGSHTDQRGGDSSNLKLSLARAKMVKSYLTSHGVPDNMLRAVGYGEREPVWSQAVIDTKPSKSEREDLYQVNRRTEFKILRIPDKFFMLTDKQYAAGSLFHLRYGVLYDLGKPTLRPESYPFLDSFADWMMLFPRMIIEIGVHVDSRGSDAYTTKLTTARAQSIKDYLVDKKGISAERLIVTGYGETQPIHSEESIYKLTNREEQEKLHQVNRRTEFRILRVTGWNFTFADTVFEEGGTMRTYSILYDLAKATLRPEDSVFLDSLADFLLAHPLLTVEIGVHTDVRTSSKSSQRLSSARAHSIVSYLIAKGVPRDQLVEKGYEGTKPLISEAEIAKTPTKGAQEELHAKNRRTEIKIIEVR